MKLSAVLITKNQGWNAARLVRSVLGEVEALSPHAEVVLVDSASDDNTAEEAAKFPIRVLVLSSDQPLTAAAGRHVGFVNTTGEYVLFLDGDMELIPGWLRQGMAVLDQDGEIGAVTGTRVDLPLDATGDEFRAHHVPGAGDDEALLRDVAHGGGAAIYRRSALEEVGSFNPYVYSDEEPELCIRLRHQGGYRIVQLDVPHLLHYTEPIERMTSLIRRAVRNLYVGSGQNIRYLWRTPLLRPYLRERGFAIVPGVTLLAGVASMTHAVVTGAATWPVVWVAMVLAVVAVDAIRKRSLRAALLSSLKRVLHVIGTMRGLVMTPADPDGYPGRFTVMR